ncbi:MAG: rod shape-determining protein RodA, partial [Nitrospirae bacterium]|nr:rod shape-determining protein RodA [Nitrospirota bacterium]
MRNIDRRLINNFDWLTFSLILTLSIVGIITIFSSTRPALDTGQHPDLYFKQSIWLLIGLISFFIVVSFDYIWFHRLA